MYIYPRNHNFVYSHFVFYPFHLYRVYTGLRLHGRSPHAGSDPPFAPRCKCKSPAPIGGLTRLLCSSKFVGFDTAFLCKQKAGTAPAMYRTFPCVASKISYLHVSSFVLPHLRGLLLECNHCVNASQWNPTRWIWPTSWVRPRNWGTV